MDCENPGRRGKREQAFLVPPHLQRQFKRGGRCFAERSDVRRLRNADDFGDAGEFSHSIDTTFQTLLTGFTRSASVITVKYPGRTIELDNLMYQAGGVSLPPGTLNLTATLTWDDGTPVAGSLNLSQLTGPGSPIQLGTFAINPFGGASGSVNINLTQPDPLTFQVTLIGTNNTALGAPATFQVGKIMFPTTLTGINAKIVLSKSTATIKSFDMSLVP